MKSWRIIWKSIVALLLAAVLLLVILQVALRPAVLTRVVNRVAAQYTDGTLTFQEVRAHVIKSFPYLHVEARDISLTYPHSLYARYDSVYQDNGRRFSLLKAGWQRDSSATEPQDTLLSAAEMALSVDYATFLSRKELHLHKLRLLRPRTSCGWASRNRPIPASRPSRPSWCRRWNWPTVPGLSLPIRWIRCTGCFPCAAWPWTGRCT